MDKNAIKKYAVWARRELISRVSQRAALYEITDKGYGDASADSVLGRVMSAEEKRQRQALIAQIREKGYEQVMEEIAYTWFNRFIALRFMEVNGYLPSRVRVFTDDENIFRPQILAEAINMELDGLDMEKVYALKNANDDDALFKYMIIVQCNALSRILPGMFQRISDYTELLFPDNLLREGSVIEQMVSMIPEEDWTDQVQIIGWLYQYYNTEPKDKVFADLKKNIKISKENIPAATQLFTPDWIVRYMVENSLGRLWLEGHPNNELKASWKYYLDEAEQEPDVQAQLTEIRKKYASLKPEDILVIDPCQGSGHILAYMFDVLVQIYEAYGYTAREAAASIIEHNIWGLDIDTRAAQLSYFSLMMKARQYDRRFFSRKVQPHVYAIQESNNLDEHSITYFVNSKASLATSIRLVIDSLFNAKEYGSIIDCSEINFDELFARVDEIQSEEEPSLYSTSALDQLLPLIQIANVIAQKYHVVVTNPPYMSASGMSSRLSEYVKKHFPESKADLFAVFIEKCGQMCQPYGFQAMITQQAWMFLSGYERLRDKLRKQKDIINLVHLGAHAFEEIGGEVVQTAAFIMMKGSVPGRIGSYVRLVKQGSQSAKEQAFLSGANRYEMKQEDFLSVPGQRIVYWLGSASLWNHEKISGSFISGGRNKTHNNEKYVREWWEIIRSSDWVLYMNGGNYRKWYGNLQQVVNWTDSAKREYASHGGLVDQKNVDSYGISWNGICGDLYGFRIKPLGIPFSSSSPTIVNQSNIPPLSVLGFLNSAVSHSILTALNPTLQLNVGEVLDTPLELPDDTGRIDELVKDNIAMAKNDWDSYETSWDFQIHPMLPVYADDPDYAYLVSSFFKGWASRCEDRFNKIKANEGELNRIFIDAYGLQGELSPEVEDKDITVRKAELQRDIKSLISYAVGCMFGRYAYDGAGLAYAGGEWDESRYGFIPVDRDNIIPICDDEYFEDDIVGRFVEFIRKAYGNTTLEENLRFIADALGGSGSPRDVIRNYFINDFYADHLKIYQKRPIYWLFDSGKKNGFKCLIYMHRYQPDTIARIRTDYVHEQQSRYRTAIADLESRIANAGTGERVKLSKQLSKLQDQAEELRVYEEKIHHLADQMIRIDLDDGVKHNYAIFQDVLAKIK
jgi:Eco57I restriction endonuclease.